MTTINYNDLFRVNQPSDWCKHKKALWKLLMDHINRYFILEKAPSVTKEEVISFIESYFDATNFAYAYYQPQESDPIFLIAKSQDAEDFINKKGDLKGIFKSFLLDLGLIFCTFRNNHEYFKFHRVDEDLSFREISITDPTIKFLANQQTCCERMIFENIINHVYGIKALDKDFQAQLNGKVKIYTEFEPCIRFGCLSPPEKSCFTKMFHGRK